MPIVNKIMGRAIALRLVQPQDAGYIHSLRINPNYNQHLSTVSGTVEDQQNWIIAYKLREAKGLEFYFVIDRLDGIPCGVVRLYDICAETFTWGSWILDHNKPPKAALESAILSFGFGFGQLKLATAMFDVRQENKHATAFYRRFGATEVGQDSLNLYFELTKKRFLSNLSAHQAAISAGQKQ
jgi:RimJ/RimL family protein N-acetyltransferase